MAYRKVFFHMRCGGIIDTNPITGRRCKKCGKRWGFFKFLLTPDEIRAGKIKDPYMPERVPTSHAKWADNKLPIAGDIASRLPNWPRWARILSTLAFVGVLIIIVYFIFWHQG